jgi:hypothetical protein
MLKRLSTAVTFAVLATTSSASAASFDVVMERKTGDWSAILYRNQNGGRLFCALEANAGGTVFRISRYRDKASDTFLEVHNPDWSLIEAKSRFSIDMQIEKEAYSVELMGDRLSDAYVHDFTDNNSYLALLGMIAKTSSLEVKNPNGARVFKTGGRGSGAALSDFGDCTRAEGTPETP